MSRRLENWITSYLEYSQFSEAPNTFHFWTSVSALAGALRRHVWIDQGYFQWTPCFYIVFVAPPGIVSKSTTAAIGMNILREVPGIHFGPDVVTWQSLVQSLSTSTEGFDFEQQTHTMSTVTISSSEFGTFLNPNDREMVDVLVSLWDGQIGIWEKHTKTSGSDQVVNPWINIIACTTPAWIQGNFPEYMIGGGFTSRTIFVYAEEKRQLVAYPGDELPEDYDDKRTNLIHDLEHISVEIVGPYTLSPSAVKWGEDWYEKLYEQNRDSLAGDRFAGYVARKQTHLHKLAIILRAARTDDRVIEPGDLQLAEGHLLESEEHQQQVFSKIVSPDAKAANLVVERMRRLGRSTRQSLYRDLYQQLSHTQFDDGVVSGIAAGLITQSGQGGEMIITFLGAPSAAKNPVSKSG